MKSCKAIDGAARSAAEVISSTLMCAYIFIIPKLKAQHFVHFWQYVQI